MKPFACVLAAFVALAIGVPIAVAQAPAGPSASSTQAQPAPSSPGADVKTDGSNQPAKGSDGQPNASVNVGRKGQTTSDQGDDGSALPRSAAGHSAIFGLSPTAAVIVGAALLVVVILAIVAMTRPGETTYVDRDRQF